MSKRKIKGYIESGKVNGWDDPRLPTVRGIINNGMSIAGLKEFAKSTGFSKNIITMEWDKIWGINRKIIDPISTRIACLNSTTVIILEVADHANEEITIPAYSKNTSLGFQQIHRTSHIYINAVDYDQINQNEEITLLNWGNMIVDKNNSRLYKHLDRDFKKNR
jgi:glutamyl/glutaminyl-tRNA synthetase